jgi:osmotically-inducible protein OsmY
MMKKIIWCVLALLFAGIVLFGCASSPATGNAGVTGTAGAPTTGGTTGTGTSAPTTTAPGTAKAPGDTDTTPKPTEETAKVDDLTITNAVLMKLRDEGIIPSMDIQVQVKDGEVTLSGKVADQATADKIVQLVSTVDHVKDVDSKLEVSQ